MGDGCRTAWDTADIRKLIELRNDERLSVKDIADRLARSFGSVRRKMRSLMSAGVIRPFSLEDTIQAATKAVASKKVVINEQVERPAATKKAAAPKVDRVKAYIQYTSENPPIDVNDKETIRNLEAKIARLTTQLTWAQHAESPSRTGGLLTLRASDHHYGDSQHLLSTGLSLEQKFLAVIEQYIPDRIQIVAGDDWIAGRGVYKEQDLDMAAACVNEQIAIGAVKAHEFLTRIRSVTSAPIVWRVLAGNHERVTDNTSMSSSLFLAMKNFCSDIPDVKFVHHGDSVTTSLSDLGTYNVLVKHGFGYSATSPNSPAFVGAIKDELIYKQRNMQPGEQYRRILSGHVHYFNVGMEHIVGLNFDTTGGLQRNTRIRLGANQRPTGWIAYVSPRGMTSNILSPIGLVPDEDTYNREVADPYLSSANRIDAGKAVKKYFEVLTERGDLGAQADFGVVNSGRW